jgi:hypothetical protein
MQSLTENHVKVIDQNIPAEKIMLHAALQRLQIFALINQERRVQLGHFNETYEDGTPAWTPVNAEDYAFKYFSLAPLTYRSILDLLKSGSTDLSGCPLTDEDRFGQVWKDSPSENDKPLEVRLTHLYADKEELEPLLNSNEKSESIKNNETPKSRPTSSSETKKYKSALKIVAGLSNKLNININERGAATKIQRLVEEAGLRITDDTIRNHLIEAKNLEDD